MKTKHFNKKLVLKKNTIANLGNGAIKAARGGGTFTKELACCPDPAYTDDDRTCPSCNTYCNTCVCV